MYAGGLYPAVAPVVAFLPGLVPVSVASILIGVLLVWAPGYLVLNLIRWRRGRWPKLSGALLRTLAGYLVVLTLGFHSFFLFWGYNYLRPPLERRLGFDAGAPAPETPADDRIHAVRDGDLWRLLEPLEDEADPDLDDR